LSGRARLLVLLLAALLGFAAAETPVAAAADRVVGDLARALRAWLTPGDPAASGRVVVVALDEESHVRPPFAALPRALWTPQLAAVVEAALDAGAAVVGVDLVLATTAEPVLAGYDRPLLKTLRRGGREGRLILAEVQDARRPLVPAALYAFALGGGGARGDIRAANMPLDPDGVARRLFLRLGDGRLAFAAELARRAGAEVPDREMAILDFGADPTPVPTLSFADLHACLGTDGGGRDFLARHLAGRVVLVGSMLTDVDRFRAGNRLAVTAPEGGPDARCTPDPAVGALPTAAPGTTAGVQLQAAAADQLIAGRDPRPLGPPARRAAALATGLLAAAPLVLSGVGAPSLAATAGVLAAPLPLAALALPAGLVLPAGGLTLAGLAAAAAGLIAREALVDRALRRMRRGFGLYLPPPEVDRLLAERLPELGGELREVTILFADLAGYTGFAEQSRPADLVAYLNRHFARLGAAVTAEGGFVFQYLGDGMLAVFGAPGRLVEHPTAAVDAAVACLEAASAEPHLRLRIGIATGEALVGNIGSPHRFNYAVVGDVVNLAARVEGLNKAYGTGLMVAESAARRYRGRHALREVDRVLVVGRGAPLSLYGAAATSPGADGGYEAAFAAYRTGDFARAAELFEALAPTDSPAATMGARARALERDPPPGWDGVFRHTSK
jgi:adenylate cyclase